MLVTVTKDGRSTTVGAPTTSPHVVSVVRSSTEVAVSPAEVVVATASREVSVTVEPREVVVGSVAAASDPDGARSIRRSIAAAAPIGSPRAVGLDALGMVVAWSAAAPPTPQPIGVTETSASGVGDPVTVVLAGRLVATGAGWTPGLPLFAGSGGLLTQAPPATGHLAVVGVAETEGSASIEVAPAIALS